VKAAFFLYCSGEIRELPNEIDYVWNFTGGTPPTQLFKATGIAFGPMKVIERSE